MTQGRAEWPADTQDLQHKFPGGQCHYGTESPVLWNSAFIHPTFFEHTISFLFPDPDYALKHTEIIRSPGQGWAGSVPLCTQTCAHTHLAGWPCFKHDTNSGQQFKWNIQKETWKLEDNCSLFQQEKQSQFITSDKVYNDGIITVYFFLIILRMSTVWGYLLHPYPSSLNCKPLTLTFPNTFISTTPSSYGCKNSIQAYIPGTYRTYKSIFIFRHIKNI